MGSCLHPQNDELLFRGKAPEGHTSSVSVGGKLFKTEHYPSNMTLDFLRRGQFSKPFSILIHFANSDQRAISSFVRELTLIPPDRKLTVRTNKDGEIAGFRSCTADGSVSEAP